MGKFPTDSECRSSDCLTDRPFTGNMPIVLPAAEECVLCTQRQCIFRPAVLHVEPETDLPGYPQDEGRLDNWLPPICAPGPGCRRQSVAHNVTLLPRHLNQVDRVSREP